MTVRASRVRPTDAQQVQDAVREQLTPLTGPFDLKTRVDVPHRGARVQ
jgi:hypothetical protein